jgi:Uma2 family endonuclease
MNATVARPQTGYRLSRAELRLRWEQLADDPMVAAIPCKIELNEKGAIEVIPPTTRHGTIQAFVARELARQRPEGTVITECPVETDIGMRVPDGIWASPGFMDRHRGEQQFQHAPDLCCEVLSPRNTQAEISEKVAAYLAAGAQEVWVVGDDGVPEIHTGSGQASASMLGFVLPRIESVA